LFSRAFGGPGQGRRTGQRIIPGVQRSSANYGFLTAGKYDRVEGTGFNLQPWSKDKNGILEIAEMSRGTLDQFYLSLRLEALRATFPKDLPPFILDDALVFSDPKRRLVLLDVLREYSESGQVIYLTCQDWPELRKFACLHLGSIYTELS
jgi:uncharacterized protein YhaN